MTYTAASHEAERQAVGLAARRDQDPAVFPGSAARSGLSAAIIAAGRVNWNAALQTNADHRREVSRTPNPGCPADLADIYRIDQDAIVLIEVFSKKTGKTPKSTIDLCRSRLKDYDNEAK